jgi:pimeloyl-ACP methyl ester carboxylesterase
MVAVQVNGVELFVRRFGDPALPMLVVVHGGPTWDHSYLLPVVAELADVAHVVLFDLRGCGRSSRVPPLADDQLQPDLLADDVAALVRHLGAERADVLGFSYGGGVAMRVVDQHPAVVRRLILASTTAYGEFEAIVPPQRAALCTPVDWNDPALTGDGELSRAMALADLPVMIWRLDRADEWRAVLDEVRFSSDWNAPFAAGTLKTARPPDPPGALNAWGGPVLILHGAREMVFPVDVARRLHAEVPASTLAEIPGAAHMAHFDNPRPWLAAIRSFLAAGTHLGECTGQPPVGVR